MKTVIETYSVGGYSTSLCRTVVLNISLTRVGKNGSTDFQTVKDELEDYHAKEIHHGQLYRT